MQHAHAAVPAWMMTLDDISDLLDIIADAFNNGKVAIRLEIAERGRDVLPPFENTLMGPRMAPVQPIAGDFFTAQHR